MQKVYILLRDNKQSGPYSLEEIVALGLKPFDLVWVEGRSYGWSYPSEINALKPYVPEAPASVQPQGTESIPSTPPTYTHTDTTTSSSPKDLPSPRNVFVSLPGKGTQPVAKKEPPPARETPPAATDWDRRVEEVRQRAQASAFAKPQEEELPSLNTNYARSLDEVEEEYTSWVYRQKSKKKLAPAGRLIAFLVVGGLLLGGGYLAITSLSRTHPKEEEVSLKTQPAEPQETALTQPEAVEPTAGEQALQPQPGTTLLSEVAKTPGKTASPASKTVTTQKPAGQTVAGAQSAAAQQPAIHTTPVDVPTEEPVVAQAPQEKKKTLADKIDGFIEKIASKGRSGASKEDADQPSRTAPDGGTGERRSTRRGEEGAAAGSSAELARQVDVVANNTDNWMMGVKDLKLTVRNNSPVTVKQAAVEVSYYSESDALLDKKTVTVSNIPSKGRKTVAAPDQRMADHVELRLLSVSADDEAYAQQ